SERLTAVSTVVLHPEIKAATHASTAILFILDIFSPFGQQRMALRVARLIKSRTLNFNYQ
ncbi:hypothetical protein SB783_45585, partial [Paraburkholderia sp. SIMBA_009]